MGMISTTLRAAWLHSWNKPREAPRRFWLAMKAIFSKKQEMWDGWQVFRINSCQNCHLFDRKWMACGNGKDKLSNGEFVGCLCYMPFKVTIKTATCWLHDQGVTDQGWPKET